MTVKSNSWPGRVGVKESVLGGWPGGPAVCPGRGLGGRGAGGVCFIAPLGGMLQSIPSSPDWVEREWGNLWIWSRHRNGKNAGDRAGRGLRLLTCVLSRVCIALSCYSVSWWEWWQRKASIRKPEISLSIFLSKSSACHRSCSPANGTMLMCISHPNSWHRKKMLFPQCR